MFCTKCGTQNVATGEFCTSCGNQLKAAAAPNTASPQPGVAPPPAPSPYAAPAAYHAPAQAPAGIWSRFKIPIIGGGAAIVLAVVLFIVFSGGSIVGTWELVEVREYFNGRLDWSEPVHPNHRMQIEFMRNGDVFNIENGRRFHEGTWESSGRNQITVRDGWSVEVMDYRIRGRELRISEVETWGGERYEYVMVFRRVR